MIRVCVEVEYITFDIYDMLNLKKKSDTKIDIVWRSRNENKCHEPFN